MIIQSTPTVGSCNAAFKRMEKNFSKYQEYKEYFEINKQDYPKFIQQDKEYKSSKGFYNEKTKYIDIVDKERP